MTAQHLEYGLGNVTVPDLGSIPPPYSPSGLVVVFGVIAIVGVVAFVVSVLSARRLTDRGVSPWRPFVATLAIVVVGVAAAATASVRDQAAHQAATDRYWDAQDAARARVVADLQGRFGVTLSDPFQVPLDKGAVQTVDLVRADGTAATCWLGSHDDVYEIRCGGGDWDTSAALEPVSAP